jgi:hypothetical protein
MPERPARRVLSVSAAEGAFAGVGDGAGCAGGAECGCTLGLTFTAGALEDVLGFSTLVGRCLSGWEAPPDFPGFEVFGALGGGELCGLGAGCRGALFTFGVLGTDGVVDFGTLTWGVDGGGL